MAGSGDVMATALSTADPGRMGQQHEARMSGILLAPISGSGRLFGVGDEGMKALDRDGEGRYAWGVVATATAGRGNPMHVRRTSAPNGVFLRLKFFNGGRCGEAERLAGVLTGRISTPAFVRHQLCGKSSGGLQSQLGAAS